MYICQFINDRFISNFNKFRCDEALKTRWGKSDTLDCHMGVTWFDAARWLPASRRLMITMCHNSGNCSFIFRPNVNINCIEYLFYTCWKYFLECCGDPFSARRRLGSTWHLAGEILSTTPLGHVIARPTHRPTSYTLPVAVEPYFNH